jgi:transcriptional regulator with XRE-family HTH domain
MFVLIVVSRDGEGFMMIGQRLIDLRKSRGLTQRELSALLFVNYRTYSGYERNESEASDDFKIRLADFHNVSVDYLLGVDARPRPCKDGYEYFRVPMRLSDVAREEAESYIQYLVAKEKK